MSCAGRNKWAKLTDTGERNRQEYGNYCCSIHVILCPVSTDQLGTRRKSRPPSFIPTSARTYNTDLVFPHDAFERRYPYLIHVERLSESILRLNLIAYLLADIIPYFSFIVSIYCQHFLKILNWCWITFCFNS